MVNIQSLIQSLSYNFNIMDSGIDYDNLTAEQIVELIQQSLSGDNQKIKHSTKVLKTYAKHKSAIRVLSYILINANQLGHRQMATVLLKRNLVNLYENLNSTEKAEFRNLLLSQYIKETHLLIQKGIASLISILLPIVDIKNWTQLQQLLDEALKSAPNSAATFVLLNSILYHFKAPKELYMFLLNSLKTPNLVQEAIKCVTSVVQSQDIDASLAVEFIKIWEQSDWPEEICLIATEVLTTMVERKVKLADEVTVWVCQKIVGNRKLSNRFRTAGCDYLFSLTDCMPKQLGSKESLLKKVVQTVCLTCSQPHKHRDDDDEGEPGQLVQEIALWLIETLAVSIKSKKIYPVLFEAAIALINSEDVNKMNTGFLVLGATCEGCAEKVKKNLSNPIMNVLIPKGLAHEAPEVRGAAINALCYFSQHLIPDVFEHHAVVIPNLMKYIGDLSPKVVTKSLIAIDVFFDGMDQEDILLYLDVVIPRLNQVIGSQKASPLMKAASISAMGSAVQVAELKFEPYLAQVLPACQYLLQLPPSPEANTLRSQNLSVMGKLANVFCKSDYANSQAFYQNYIMNTMETVYGFLLNEQDPEVRESAFAFFYLIANAIGDRFEIVFDKLVPIVMKSCQPKEAPQKGKDFSLDSDSEDEGNGVRIVTEKATQHDEKAAAIHAMGEFAKACSVKFTPYFQQAYKLLDEHYQHFYDNIRIQVCHCYTNLTVGLVRSQNNGQLPQIKKGLPCVDRYPANLEEIFRTKVIQRLIFIINEDEEKKVRGSAVESMDDLIKQLGPAFIDRNLPALTEAIMKLLQADVDEVDSEDEQQAQDPEDQQTEVYTFEAVCDLIPTLAQNLRSGFEPNLNELHPYMLRYIEEREEVNDNVQMTGTLSQCFKCCPGYVVNHAQQLFKALSALVQLWDSQVNRNVAYCYAEMFEKASHAMGPYLQDALINLKQIFQHASSDKACKQNAVAAICRIIYTINPPMPHQVFVDNLIKMMPFSGDEQEESTAWKCLIFLFRTNAALITPYRDQLSKIMENDFSNTKKYNLTEELQAALKEFFGQLYV